MYNYKVPRLVLFSKKIHCLWSNYKWSNDDELKSGGGRSGIEYQASLTWKSADWTSSSSPLDCAGGGDTWHRRETGVILMTATNQGGIIGISRFIIQCNSDIDNDTDK